MSESFLRVVPASPQWRPSQQAAEAAADIFRRLCPDADEVSIGLFEEVTFIDQGSLFETVSCPACDARLEIDWWEERMDDASTSAFTTLGTVVPCCDTSVSLNDLAYDWPAAFARFALEARNPSRDWLTPAEAASISLALGVEIRQVISRI